MQTIPNWLVPLWNGGAAWTDLFDSDAWAAIATAGATGAALWISGREERRAKAASRSADVRLLKALLLVFVNGFDATRKTAADLRLPEYRDGGPTLARIAVESSAEVSRCLDEFSPAAMPSTTAVDLLMSARVSWKSILEMLEHVGRLSTSTAERLFPDMSSPAWLAQLGDGPWDRANEVIDAIADEVIRRGGTIEDWEDSSVRSRLSDAMNRASNSTLHA
jgi:hypothetical protein